MRRAAAYHERATEVRFLFAAHEGIIPRSTRFSSIVFISLLVMSRALLLTAGGAYGATSVDRARRHPTDCRALVWGK